MNSPMPRPRWAIVSIAFFACICAANVTVATAASPTISLSAGSGSPNAKIRVDGSGFPAGEIAALYLDSPALYLDVPGPRADAQGAFSKTITVPGASNGVHQICADTGYPGANQQIVAKACVQFIIHNSPSPRPSATPGASGSPASVPEFLIAGLVVIAVVGGVILWMRRSA
jgi:hypothetical protein